MSESTPAIPDPPKNLVIIGAGPAGLTAAYELSKHNITGTILEANSVVGGIARTVVREGYRFDLGGHRFFTKVKEIDLLWDEMLGEPMLIRPRTTRILYDGKFYDYPLKPWNALRNMGVVKAVACVLSYFKARLFPIRNPKNFEEWVTNQFGKKLFNMFFKSYTEKVWGCPCSEIGADWAAQRIKGLSLGKAVWGALFGTNKKGGKIIKTLIDEFKYPRQGPGQLWEACAKTVVQKQWKLNMQTRAGAIQWRDGRVVSVETRSVDGRTTMIDCDHLMSTMPLRELLHALDPTPPRRDTRRSFGAGLPGFPDRGACRR